MLRIIAIVAALMAAANSTPATRVMNGNYHDYMVIETLDGNEWLLDDAYPEENPYMQYDADYGHYESIFEEGDLVQVVFDTKGTKGVTDDVIVFVRRIGGNYRD